MENCWQESASERPNVQAILSQLNVINPQQGELVDNLINMVSHKKSRIERFSQFWRMGTDSWKNTRPIWRVSWPSERPSWRRRNRKRKISLRVNLPVTKDSRNLIASYRNVTQGNCRRSEARTRCVSRDIWMRHHLFQVLRQWCSNAHCNSSLPKAILLALPPLPVTALLSKLSTYWTICTRALTRLLTISTCTKWKRLATPVRKLTTL